MGGDRPRQLRATGLHHQAPVLLRAQQRTSGSGYDRIADFEPFRDGFGTIRDAQTTKPQSFCTGVRWFAYNLAVNLAQMQLSRRGCRNRTIPQYKRSPPSRHPRRRSGSADLLPVQEGRQGLAGLRKHPGDGRAGHDRFPPRCHWSGPERGPPSGGGDRLLRKLPEDLAGSFGHVREVHPAG